MTLNDFKAIEGDSRMGIRSLPVQLGADRAARVACWVMAVPQIIVVILLAQWGAPVSAVSVAVLIAAQAVLMRRLIAAPIQQALFYSGFGVPLYVSGMMVSAFALRGLG
jgi:chlorophyll synthase